MEENGIFDLDLVKYGRFLVNCGHISFKCGRFFRNFRYRWYHSRRRGDSLPCRRAVWSTLFAPHSCLTGPIGSLTYSALYLLQRYAIRIGQTEPMVALPKHGVQRVHMDLFSRFQHSVISPPLAWIHYISLDHPNAHELTKHIPQPLLEPELLLPGAPGKAMHMLCGIVPELPTGTTVFPGSWYFG